MGGTSKSTQQTSQSSKTNPWEPTVPLLNDILTGINGQISNFRPNANENTALGMLRQNAANTTNYAPQATSLANDLMSGGPDRSGMLSQSYDRFGANLAPTIAGDYLDPNKNPFFATTTKAISDDVANRVNGMFAGAGRDMSGANLGMLSSEITKATAPIYAQVYGNERGNQLDAMKSYYGAGGETAGMLSNMDQQRFVNRGAGLDVGINGVHQAQNAAGNNMLSIESLARSLPLGNLGMLAQLVGPIAGLGGQSSGTSNTQGTFTDSGMRQFQQFASGLGSLMPKAPMTFNF